MLSFFISQPRRQHSGKNTYVKKFFCVRYWRGLAALSKNNNNKHCLPLLGEFSVDIQTKNSANKTWQRSAVDWKEAPFKELVVGRFTILKHILNFPNRCSRLTYSRGPMARKKQSRNQIFFTSNSIYLRSKPLVLKINNNYRQRFCGVLKPWFIFYWFLNFFFTISPFFYLALLEVYKWRFNVRLSSPLLLLK